MSRGERSHDVVVFGATGFTGALTAQHLAAHAPPGSRLALAGRSGVRLEALRMRLATADARCARLPLAVLDAADGPALRRIAAATRVLVNAVGPYTTHGDAVVAACAEQGTDYVDLAAEGEFVDLSYIRHHDRATRTHARLVHSCGFDSIPFDLGTLHTLMQLPEGVPMRVRAFAQLHLGGVRNAARGFSTGSLRSALVMLSRPRQRARARSTRLALEPLPRDRTVEVPLGRPHRPRELEGWALPAPRFDSRVVGRSAGALDRYGPDFSYEQYVLVRRLGTAAAAIGVGGAMFTLAQLQPVRELILARLPSGAGPSAAERGRRRFTVTLVGDGGGRRILTEVRGGDPGYDESAKMLAEAALCLAHDDLPRCSGQVTPATAMGEILIARLGRQGITFTSRRV